MISFHIDFDISYLYTGNEEVRVMARTVVNLNDRLVKQAQKLTGLSKKVEVVNYALEELVKREQRRGLLKLMGTGCWKGNLEEMRRSRT